MNDDVRACGVVFIDLRDIKDAHELIKSSPGCRVAILVPTHSSDRKLVQQQLESLNVKYDYLYIRRPNDTRNDYCLVNDWAAELTDCVEALRCR